MKILSGIKSHKRISLLIALIIVLGASGTVLAIHSANKGNVANVTRQSAQVKEDTTKEPAASEPEKKVEPVTIDAAPQQTVATETAEVPATTVKSIDEIASQYPTLTGSDELESCFNAIVAKYPNRFTDDVRENNIKALTVFSSSCSTGIMQPNAIIDKYGPNGAFFDSDFAKSTR